VSDTYPAGTVRALLSTDLVTHPTRAALEARLAPSSGATPRFFENSVYETLRAVCRRLFPNSDAHGIDLAACVDERLARGAGNGWRYDALPPDDEAYRQGLSGIDESAVVLFGQAFLLLDAEAQDAVLRAVQEGRAPGTIWQTLSASHFFEELLSELSECYYSHPLAQEEIGYVGMADGRGWTRIGLNEREDWESAPSPPSSGTPPLKG
jgi:gluconate 2-dehydrogenase gamma chain